MKYDFEGKIINIPDSEIENSMKVLDLTQEEAIEMWLEDEGYLDNDVVEELTQKAKENRITATIHQAKAETPKKTQRERVRKANPTKEKIIAEIAKLLAEMGAEDVKIENIGKIITFKMENKELKVDLIEKRAKKAK